jgi:hypothetical protein
MVMRLETDGRTAPGSQFGLRSAVPRPDRTRTAVNPERNLPVLRKIAIIRLEFRAHPGNPGYTENPAIHLTADFSIRGQPWN